ncbi:DUF418 domain-containing protein [Amycolatopsis sp.]|uniref:DUF418 domain-containing protein n=1 Tax=Amycolatopsis sp. TaxID=37632 RepID=UPI002D7EB7D3|nr:DUF418 domain-containing protein [Amycolatopsis sp.]HET6708332.1 DUF418 domain-containing protein [Amycolatopsis sp.]
MLLFIALAHVPLFRYVSGGPAPFDDLVALFQGTFVDNRARPLFALLFGYGLVQLWNRHGDAVPRRRGFWLVVLGFLHVALLGVADIIAVYGMVALVFAGMLRARDRTLWWGVGLSLLPVTVLGGILGADTAAGSGGIYDAVGTPPGELTPLLVSLFRVRLWPGEMVSGVLTVLPAVLLGILAARHRVLDEPLRHRALLVKVAVTGLGVSVLGGLPLALISAGMWADPSPLLASVAGAAHLPTGYAGGLGWAALIGLTAIRFSHRRGWIVTAVVAMGQRSMTFYLAQSVVFVVVFAPYAGGFGARLSMIVTAVVAVATWVSSLVVAELMRRARYPGPAEVLLRRLPHGKPGNGVPSPRRTGER